MQVVTGPGLPGTNRRLPVSRRLASADRSSHQSVTHSPGSGTCRVRAARDSRIPPGEHLIDDHDGWRSADVPIVEITAGDERCSHRLGVPRAAVVLGGAPERHCPLPVLEAMRGLAQQSVFNLRHVVRAELDGDAEDSGRHPVGLTAGYHSQRDGISRLTLLPCMACNSRTMGNRVMARDVLSNLASPRPAAIVTWPVKSGRVPAGVFRYHVPSVGS